MTLRIGFRPASILRCQITIKYMINTECVLGFLGKLGPTEVSRSVCMEWNLEASCTSSRAPSKYHLPVPTIQTFYLGEVVELLYEKRNVTLPTFYLGV
jgi:hypothetical protein